MKRGTIPTLLGLTVLLSAVAAGVYLLQSTTIFRLGAKPPLQPKDVRTSNIGDKSVTISWLTDRETSGFVKWGESPASLNRTASDEVKETSFVHKITLTGLSPQKSYFFEIGSGGELFDQNGAPWEIKTGATLTSPSETKIASGTVLDRADDPVSGALVFIYMEDATALLSVTSATGGWAIPISQARNPDLNSYFPVTETTVAEIEVFAGEAGEATAVILSSAASATPPIKLGSDHDFRNVSVSEVGDLPEASLTLPEGATPSSGFEVGEEIATPSAQTVTLESLAAGETITTEDPEFFGKGPAGVTITITVQSQSVSTQLKIGASGSWRWDPPGTLEPGTHQITITWKDSGGILRTLSRTFIVQAAEGPAFESTPSATPTSTPTPTASPKTSPSPPTATVSATPTAPASGSLTPTIVLSIMGLLGLLIIGSVFIFGGI